MIENWETFNERIKHFPEKERWLMELAYNIAKAGHRQQVRANGVRYFEHPRGVICIHCDELIPIDERLRNPKFVIVGLLHDIGEDTPLWSNPTKHTYPEWRRRAHFYLDNIFGKYYPDVPAMALAVNKPQVNKVTKITKKESECMAIQLLQDGPIDAVVIKMEDRLHNLRELNNIPLKKRAPKIDETRTHYYPIFERARSEYPAVVDYVIDQMEIAMSKVQTS